MNENFIELSHTDISAQALEGVVKNHLLKELSSNSVISELDLEARIAKTTYKLESGKMVLVFDKVNEEVIIVPKTDFKDFKVKQANLAPVWHGAQAPEDLPF
ncbi:YheU family protein [bacterium]|nr:YheU family protein [bacterium]